MVGTPLAVLVIALFSSVLCGHYIIPYHEPYDAYHDLHLPHDPPLYPTHHEVPQTTFSCLGRHWGLFADIESGCQSFHLCIQEKLVSSNLCTNGTLFNEQFQVCDQFYNVRCGSPYEDL
ncbi:U-scoloptoxin(01)-Er1a-like [Arctopsyche grandis]|uniref:U-scoloptoxin(01)-Er1a-like n=1 Tax=Arctopsyche grandis TaxID=121162 RepID=UPI00406D741A